MDEYELFYKTIKIDNVDYNYKLINEKFDIITEDYIVYRITDTFEEFIVLYNIKYNKIHNIIQINDENHKCFSNIKISEDSSKIVFLQEFYDNSEKIRYNVYMYNIKTDELEIIDKNINIKHFELSPKGDFLVINVCKEKIKNDKGKEIDFKLNGNIINWYSLDDIDCNVCNIYSNIDYINDINKLYFSFIEKIVITEEGYIVIFETKYTQNSFDGNDMLCKYLFVLDGSSYNMINNWISKSMKSSFIYDKHEKRNMFLIKVNLHELFDCNNNEELLEKLPYYKEINSIDKTNFDFCYYHEELKTFYFTTQLPIFEEKDIFFKDIDLNSNNLYSFIIPDNFCDKKVIEINKITENIENVDKITKFENSIYYLSSNNIFSFNLYDNNINTVLENNLEIIRFDVYDNFILYSCFEKDTNSYLLFCYNMNDENKIQVNDNSNVNFQISDFKFYNNKIMYINIEKNDKYNQLYLYDLETKTKKSINNVCVFNSEVKSFKILNNDIIYYGVIQNPGENCIIVYNLITEEQFYLSKKNLSGGNGVLPNYFINTKYNKIIYLSNCDNYFINEIFISNISNNEYRNIDNNFQRLICLFDFS